MKKLLFILIITIASINIFGQTPDILAKSFLDDMNSRGIENAIKYASKDSVMSVQTKIDKISQQFANQKTKLGKYYGYEEVKTKDNEIQCYVVKTYILKFENAPTQINLVYYKPNDKWLLHNVIAKQYNNKRTRK
jgi:hypothetical protein